MLYHADDLVGVAVGVAHLFNEVTFFIVDCVVVFTLIFLTDAIVILVVLLASVVVLMLVFLKPLYEQSTLFLLGTHGLPAMSSSLVSELVHDPSSQIPCCMWRICCDFRTSLCTISLITASACSCVTFVRRHCTQCDKTATVKI